MSEILLLYLFTRLDSIKTFLGITAVIASIIGGVFFLMWVFSKFEVDCNDGTVAKKIEGFPVRAARNILVSIIVLNLLLPSQKDMAIIIGGKLAVDAVHSELAQKLLVLVNGVLDKEITDLKGGAKK